MKKHNGRLVVEGIYNYCDRWCERCTYTSRCLNYAIDQEKFGDMKEKDITTTGKIYFTNIVFIRTNKRHC